MARAAGGWLSQSIVARRGLGWSKKPTLHELTEAKQEKYHYTIGPYSDPVLAVGVAIEFVSKHAMRSRAQSAASVISQRGGCACRSSTPRTDPS
jgi:hypothetical protein